MTTSLAEAVRVALEERAVRLDVMANAPEPRPMATRHYSCPDCGQVCACTGDARLLPHTRCGLPTTTGRS
jgi:acetone carboxylase gamma subunit